VKKPLPPPQINPRTIHSQIPVVKDPTVQTAKAVKTTAAIAKEKQQEWLISLIGFTFKKKRCFDAVFGHTSFDSRKWHLKEKKTTLI